ncbi:MAG: hypothetical protein JSU73_00110, partial [candidate division WOR-3 bacterium]
VRLRSAEETEASKVAQTRTFAPETLHWDGPNFYGIGSGGGTFLAAARFTAPRPRTLTNMLWYAYDSFDWASIVVYGHGTDTTPGPVLDSFPYNGSGTGWKDVLLPQQLYLPAYRDFWACIAVNHSPRVRPVGIDSGPQVRDRGGFIRIQGGSWRQLYQSRLDYNWNIRAVVGHVEHDVGVMAIAVPDTVEKGAVVTPRVVVANYGGSAETFPVCFYIDTLPEEVTIYNLMPGSVDTVQFSVWVPEELGRHTLRCTTMLDGDEFPDDDCMTKDVEVLPGTGLSGPAVRSGLVPSLAVFPSPAVGRFLVRGALPALAHGRLELVSPTGEVLRKVPVRTSASGEYELGLDMADGSGSRLPAGVYLVRLRSRDQSVVRRFVLAR